MNRDNPGILIAVEGIDGAGKTTQVDLLTQFFESVGEPLVRSKEPTDGPWGQKIRRSAANGRLTLREELAAFIEDRKEHLRDKILPALRCGKTVILDRYFYSTIAYQGARSGDVEGVAAAATVDVPEPDAVLLLDLPPAVGRARIAEGRGETPNAFETADNLKDVRAAFLRLAASRPHITVIDASPSAKIVQATILKTLLDGVLMRRHCAKHWGCDDPFNCAYRITGECRWATMMKRADEFVQR